MKRGQVVDIDSVVINGEADGVALCIFYHVLRKSCLF